MSQVCMSIEGEEPYVELLPLQHLWGVSHLICRIVGL